MDIKLAQVAYPAAQQIANLYAGGETFRKFDPVTPSKLVDGWFITHIDADGNELEIHVRTRQLAHGPVAPRVAKPNECDGCFKVAELYHHDPTGEALCEECDLKAYDSEAELRAGTQ